jgi:hypothetical protein
MMNIAKALTNDTARIEEDVKEIFAFEKEIAKVTHCQSCHIFCFLRIFLLLHFLSLLFFDQNCKYYSKSFS